LLPLPCAGSRSPGERRSEPQIHRVLAPGEPI
jgi:hypothetical protein